jgi:hypothetical protein
MSLVVFPYITVMLLLPELRLLRWEGKCVRLIYSYVRYWCSSHGEWNNSRIGPPPLVPSHIFGILLLKITTTTPLFSGPILEACHSSVDA